MDRYLKVKVEFNIKADPSDDESVRNTLYSYLQDAMEYEELDYQISTDEDSEEDEYDN